MPLLDIPCSLCIVDERAGFKERTEDSRIALQWHAGSTGATTDTDITRRGKGITCRENGASRYCPQEHGMLVSCASMQCSCQRIFSLHLYTIFLPQMEDCPFEHRKCIPHISKTSCYLQAITVSLSKQATLVELYRKLAEHGLNRLGPERVLRKRLYIFGKFSRMDLQQLHRELSNRGLETVGDVQVLVRRLTDHETRNYEAPKIQSHKLPVAPSAVASTESGPYANMTTLELCSELLKRDLDASGSAHEMRQRLIANDAGINTNTEVVPIQKSSTRAVKASSSVPDSTGVTNTVGMTDNFDIDIDMTNDVEDDETIDSADFGKYTHMKLLELRSELKNRGLVLWGTVAALKRRLTDDDARTARNTGTELMQYTQLGALPARRSSLVHQKKFVFFVSCYNLAQKTSFCQIDQKVRCACRV